ncbi:tetratricopeptide repeat protein [Rhodosalinus sp. FB01]|uniref:tetratricopeptide repeat protein n=1 Tax=Rhodosalinus sp. FB01 TaxID=3239194 RepID=UPI00352521A8
MRFAAILAAALLLVPVAAAAQEADRARTLADIRQDLTVLNVEIQRLRRELATTGSPDMSVAGGSSLERLDSIESALQRLTARTEELEYRIARIVEDGTNRIGDLEFRLVELEGGDVSALGETPTLGGLPADPLPGPAPASPAGPGGTDTPQLAVSERSDFERAEAALAEGRHEEAAEAFGRFRETYPGSPLEPQVYLGLGRALEAQEDMRGAAQVYLDGFSAHPDAGAAPETLYRLGAALAALDRIDAACQILADVGVRFPGSQAADDAAERKGGLGCP